MSSGICVARLAVMRKSLVPVERITWAILVCRRHRVLLDRDLAALYGVETKALNQAVRRNRARFPSDFMFQLTATETTILRSQSVTASAHGGRRTRPYAFTEQGIAMLSSVLRSQRAIVVNIEIMRAFVKLRRILQSHADLARRLDALERKYDGRFAVVFDAIRKLTSPEIPPGRRIGFRAQSAEYRENDLRNYHPIILNPTIAKGTSKTKATRMRRSVIDTKLAASDEL